MKLNSMTNSELYSLWKLLSIVHEENLNQQHLAENENSADSEEKRKDCIYKNTKYLLIKRHLTEEIDKRLSDLS